MTDTARAPRVSVLMPTFKQAAFIRRALDSLRAQTMPDWELIVVDDGSPDATRAALAPYLTDQRIAYHRLERNAGLGAALNLALEYARAPLIAYLPSDDVLHADHLARLADCLDHQPQAVAAYTGVRHHYNKFATGPIEGFALQLVQVMHRQTADRWLQRDELVTDDLERMFWTKLRQRGAFIGTDQITCEWVSHPAQRHKIVRESDVGGINPYRVYYEPQTPLRYHTTVGHFIDEVAHYQRFRERPPTPRAPDGLKILLVGELAYNAERVLALAERGHTLYGLWTPTPAWFNMVGPVPFGHVQDIARADWRRSVQQIQPDIIYALLNWQTVPFVHQVLQNNPGIPFVWHFKEGPFICLEKGTWPQLVDLHTRSDGRIYSSPELRAWFDTIVPDQAQTLPSLVLDGDLPKQDWFADQQRPRISATDGAWHTVVPGRPIGLHVPLVAELAQHGIHLHFYGDFTHGLWREWIERALKVAPQHLHLHPNVAQDQWVSEFSQYDAGWLHFFASDNAGDLRRANWDDLNYPARIATLAVAGLPLLQRDNSGAVVATQSLARAREIGVEFATMEELRTKLDDTTRMEQLRTNVWQQRHAFMFDTHADTLIDFFRQVIALRRG